MLSWVTIDEEPDFSLQNLPYGIFSTDTLDRRPGVAVGASVLDLKVLVKDEVFGTLGFDTTTLEEKTLNRYAGLSRKIHQQVRALLQQILRIDTSLGHVLRDNDSLRKRALVPLEQVKMHLPMDIGDYTDFLTSSYHGLNCCELFGLGSNLPRGFYDFPLGYGGRASSVVVSGTPVRRPQGQSFVEGRPTFGPYQTLDFEAEFAAFVGMGNDHGSRIDIHSAEDYIFGFVFLNDWSARDFQMAESGPIGPLNGKGFCTTVSPWIVTLDALEAFRTSPVEPGPLLPYLDEGNKKSLFDLPIDVELQVGPTRYHVSKCNTKHSCFSLAQMLTQLTSGGLPTRPGDLFATGTLSGPTREELGCLLEASRHGASPREMKAPGSSSHYISRAYLEDGDIVHFSARVKCPDGPVYIGFGRCSGQIIKSI